MEMDQKIADGAWEEISLLRSRKRRKKNGSKREDGKENTDTKELQSRKEGKDRREGRKRRRYEDTK